jgi:hypothetical protein
MLLRVADIKPEIRKLGNKPELRTVLKLVWDAFG